jgi:hypothetical protein
MNTKLLRYPLFNQRLVSVLVFTLSIILGAFVIRLNLLGIVLLFGVLILALVILYDVKNSARLFVPFLVLSLPLQPIFSVGYVPQLTVQLLGLAALFYSWLLASSAIRAIFLRKVKLLIVPTLAFSLTFFLSYLASGELATEDWVFLLRLIGSISYAYLGCIYCNSFEDVKRILWVLAIIGIIQLPVMYGQVQGWIDGLAAMDPRINHTFWAQYAASSHSSMIRVPGMFLDYELVAEYFDMMILFCTGFFILGSQLRVKIIALLSIGILIVAGFYTGTRAFLWGLGGGLLVITFLISFRLGLNKVLRNSLIIGGILVVAVIVLSRQSVFASYIERFLNTDIGINSYDTRTAVFSIDVALARGMPFLGYGHLFQQSATTLANSSVFLPHSLYLSMLLINGYPGLIVTFLFVAIPILWMLKILVSQNTKMHYAWAIVFLSVWIFWSVNEIKVEFIRQPFYMNIVFFLFGMIASVYMLARRNVLEHGFLTKAGASDA